MAELLEVRDLKVWFPIKKGVFARTSGYVKAVDGVSFDLHRGETLGVVGESGSGKSTIARVLTGLQKPTGGSFKLNGRVAMVFQDPLGSLNPRMTVRAVLEEALAFCAGATPSPRRDASSRGGTPWPRRGASSRGETPSPRRDASSRGGAVSAAQNLLALVGLDTSALDKYPHEFSGGQRQRICIARAIASKPELLICDEAVSALDLSIRAQMLYLLEDLKRKLGLSLLFITHDLGVVRHIADRILVMNRGKIIEEGPCGQVLKAPREEYTRYLISSVPRIGKPLT